METLQPLMPVIDALFAIWCAYSAGKLRAAIDFSDNDVSWSIWAVFVADLAFAVYFVIALYGHSLERGGA